MEYPQKEIVLKDGSTAIFRSPTAQDAPEIVAFFQRVLEETPYLLTSPQDPPMTAETEAAFLKDLADSKNQVMIACFVDGQLVGNCMLSYELKQKIRHRGRVGISILRDYWGKHIGTRMFEELMSIARDWGLYQLELEVFEGNDRARALYEKMGFRAFGEIPNAIRQSDGTMIKDIQMMMLLNEEA